MTFYCKFPSLNDAIAAAKTHWAVYYKMKKGYTSLVQMKVAHMKPFGLAAIEFVFCEKQDARKRDWDNVTFAKKFVLDGLVNAGVLMDDSPNEIYSITERLVYGSDYRVDVTIKEKGGVKNGGRSRNKGVRVRPDRTECQEPAVSD